ncbi:MAG: hypothetical protein ABI276_01060 [Acidimicrobiales bacterium]
MLVVRDTDHGALEVCLLRRRKGSVFVPGMYVFPGGAVDPVDREPRWEEHVLGLDGATASRRLGIEAGGLAYWVAAVRETIEECGLLLAVRADGTPLQLAAPEDRARLARYRVDLDGGSRDLFDICGDEGLLVDCRAMHYVAHWITPAGEPRRYDTRFFLAAAPDGQHAVHDGHEAVATRWVSAEQALEGNAAGQLAMLPPTVALLRWLAPYPTVAAALAAAAAIGEVPTIEPRIVGRAKDARIVLPGEPGYDDATVDDAPVGDAPVEAGRG